MDATKPNPIITLQIGSEEREIFCSFSLLNQAIQTVGGMSGIDNLPNVLLDPLLREEILKQLLCKRNKTGKVLEPFLDLGDVDISLDEISRLLDWISEHIMDFTLGALERAQMLHQKHLGRFQKIQQT